MDERDKGWLLGFAGTGMAMPAAEHRAVHAASAFHYSMHHNVPVASFLRSSSASAC